MYPDRSVTYVPGLYPVPANQRMQLAGAAVTGRSGRLAPGAWIGNIDWSWLGLVARS